MQFPFENGSWLHFNETKDNRIHRNAGLIHWGRLMHVGVSKQGYHWFRKKTVAWHYLVQSSVLMSFVTLENSNLNTYMFMQEIKNNVWITVNNDFLSRVGRFGNDFHEWRSHEWKSLPNRLTCDKKSLFTVTNVLFYFLHVILCHEHTNPLRTIIERSFRHCCQGRPFLTEHCDVTTIDLWRHANAKY